MRFETISLLGLLCAGARAQTVATSSVPGAAFNRIAIIYFENENYDLADGDGTWMQHGTAKLW